MRGDLVSRPIHEVLDEAEKLAGAGVKELLIIAQDTSAYGVDLRYRTGFWNGKPLKTHLKQLVEQLGELGIWVRLHYVYPYPHVDEIIPFMATGKILPYLDIPLQHASRRILRAMKRPADAENVLQRIRNWREQCPDITLRSTFIVGFPGETEEDFAELLRFLEQAQLDRVGAFKYSPVTGAAANALADPVPESVKEERLARFMTFQSEISAQKLRRRIGQRETVLIDRVEDGTVVARSRSDAPEIDGVVYINSAKRYVPGEFIEVDIIDSTEHDLIARPVAAGRTARAG